MLWRHKATSTLESFMHYALCSSNLIGRNLFWTWLGVGEHKKMISQWDGLDWVRLAYQSNCNHNWTLAYLSRVRYSSFDRLFSWPHDQRTSDLLFLLPRIRKLSRLNIVQKVFVDLLSQQPSQVQVVVNTIPYYNMILWIVISLL